MPGIAATIERAAPRRFGELFQYRLGPPGSPGDGAPGWGVLEMSGRCPARRSSHVGAGFDDRLFLFGIWVPAALQTLPQFPSAHARSFVTIEVKRPS